MSEGANSQLRRVSVGSEVATLYAAPGAYTHLRGAQGLSHKGQRESLADGRHLTSRMGQYASRLGQKSGDITCSVPLHAATATDLVAILTSAFGVVSANTITWSAGAAATVTKSAGEFDPIVITPVTGGVYYARPVKSVAANVATLAIQLPAASITGAKNAITGGGGAFYQSAAAEPTYLHIECDPAGESDYVSATYQGCVPEKVGLSLDLSQQLMLDLAFKAADWTPNSAANITNPSALTGQMLGFAAECFLQDIGTPAAGTQIDLHSLEINLAPQWIPRYATRANVSGAVPGSGIVGWKRGIFCPDGLKITVTKQNNSYITARTNKTPYGFFVSWSLGGPGDTATATKVALWIPRVVLDADPVEVDIDGISGYELSFKIEEESALVTDGNDDIATQACLAFFVA